MSDLGSTVRKFARQLRREFALEIEQNPRAFKGRVVGFLKSALPPGPGRPCDKAVTRAIEMRAAGKSWPEVYTACVPNNSLAPESPPDAKSRVRAAMRARKNRRKHVKSAPRLVTNP